jgi:tetratricopeptide (TPR) repeat protein
VKSPRNLLLSVLLALVAAVANAVAQNPSADPTRIFVEASRAYDEDRLADAIAGWESLADDGYLLPEVLYNLGNAYYRNGNLGPAIRAYRHAQRHAPRDPDVRANLGFAAQTAGIDLPARNPVARLLLDASHLEWRRLAGLGYGLLFLALAAWIVAPRFRFVSRPLALFAAALLALAAAGLLAHRDLRLRPEAVVVADSPKLRSGPLESATALQVLPEGAIVRQLDQRGAWTRIQQGDVRGWLPAAALATVP